MINIVIPMAGDGARFREKGYDTPKPFLYLDNSVMIKRVIENITPLEPHRFILIHRSEHTEYIKYHKLDTHSNVHFVPLDEKTEGAACTVLKAKALITHNDPLVIANSDQLVRWNFGERLVKVHQGLTSNLWFRETNSIQDLINKARLELCIGMIATFKADHPKWSYVSTRMAHGDVELVERVAEKEVISNNATCGIYFYSAGRIFIEAAEAMIAANERVKNEFYVCPVYNKIMERIPTSRISHYRVNQMIGLGTPEDYEAYRSSWNE